MVSSIEKILDTTGEVGDVLHAPDGAIWVLERRNGSNNGVVQVYKNTEAISTLTISVSAACDNGLLDVAFAPDYTATGKAFVYYVDGSGTARVDTLLLEGTSLGRAGTERPCSEAAVEEKVVDLCRATPGIVLACYSPQNIDRQICLE